MPVCFIFYSDIFLSFSSNAFSLLGPAKTQFPISSKEGVVYRRKWTQVRVNSLKRSHFKKLLQ